MSGSKSSDEIREVNAGRMDTSAAQNEMSWEDFKGNSTDSSNNASDEGVGRGNSEICPPVECFKALRVYERAYKLKWDWPDNVTGAVITISQDGLDGESLDVQKGEGNNRSRTKKIKLSGSGVAVVKIRTYRTEKDGRGGIVMGGISRLELREPFGIQCKLKSEKSRDGREFNRLVVSTKARALPRLVVRVKKDGFPISNEDGEAIGPLTASQADQGFAILDIGKEVHGYLSVFLDSEEQKSASKWEIVPQVIELK